MLNNIIKVEKKTKKEEKNIVILSNVLRGGV
jgi:hypothetical protein